VPSATIALPIGLRLLPRYRFREQQPALELGLCFDLSRVLPRLASSLTRTWRLLATGIARLEESWAAVTRRSPPLVPLNPKSLQSAEARLGAGRVLSATVALPFGLRLLPYRYREQRPDRESGLRFGLSRVPPQLTSPLTTLWVAGDWDRSSGGRVAPSKSRSPQSAEARLGSPPCAFCHGCTSVWASSASAVPIPGAATRLGVGASLWAFSCPVATCFVTHDLVGCWRPGSLEGKSLGLLSFEPQVSPERQGALLGERAVCLLQWLLFCSAFVFFRGTYTGSSDFQPQLLFRSVFVYFCGADTRSSNQIARWGFALGFLLLRRNLLRVSRRGCQGE